MNKHNLQFLIGLILAIIGALLMVFEALPISARITMGIVGLILIATGKFKLL